ncbi:hypothetical protein BVX97_02100 [bacterium E08(2017)]|nr:hypothetical protein BVX97_02100 [bacterium E08(2017)]
MNQKPFLEVVKNICANDPRYDIEAYFFVRDALDFTTQTLDRSKTDEKNRHVSGRELLEGIRKYTLKEFGPMSLTVLGSWGIKGTEDFGEIVFNLVNSGKLGCTEDDKIEDFANGYDFNIAFAKPFEPKNTASTAE